VILRQGCPGHFRSQNWPALCRYMVLAAAFMLWGGQIGLASVDQIVYDSGNRRNPFVPLIGAHIKKSEIVPIDEVMKIEGIVFDPHGGSIVLIEGQEYRLGDAYQDSVITDIQKDKVVFSQNNKKYAVSLQDEDLGAYITDSV